MISLLPWMPALTDHAHSPPNCHSRILKAPLRTKITSRPTRLSFHITSETKIMATMTEWHFLTLKNQAALGIISNQSMLTSDYKNTYFHMGNFTTRKTQLIDLRQLPWYLAKWCNIDLKPPQNSHRILWVKGLLGTQH